MSKIFPPLKKNWKPGTTQVGVFIRSPNGSTLEMSSDSVSDEIAEQATALLKAMCAPKKP